MKNDIFNIMSDGSKFSYESLQELSDINTKTFTKLADLQMSFARLGIESSVEQAKLFSGASSYDDLLSAESDLATSYSDRIVELTREATDILSASREDLMAWLEKCFEEGRKEVTSAANTATAAATQAQGQSKPKPAAKKSGSSKSGHKTAA
jgi:phasin family protein